ncbi:MAG: hypothetical protein GY910_18290 [bacterium]|nr:hypothetical protein [Deltaproteobacteria bacterium]MCP4906927.1 hypothetical protein [bacterium]
MDPDQEERVYGTSQNARFVSGRFLSDFFGALERQGIPASGLLGDLPICTGERGEVLGSVEGNHFADFMRRLEFEVEGRRVSEHAAN